MIEGKLQITSKIERDSNTRGGWDLIHKRKKIGFSFHFRFTKITFIYLFIVKWNTFVLVKIDGRKSHKDNLDVFYTLFIDP